MEYIAIHWLFGILIFVGFLNAFKVIEGIWFPPAVIFILGFATSTYLNAYIILDLDIDLQDYAYDNFDKALWLVNGSFFGLLLGYLFYGLYLQGNKKHIHKELVPFMGPATMRILSNASLAVAGYIAIYAVVGGTFSGIRGEGAYISDADVNFFYRTGFAAHHMILPIILAVFIAAKTSVDISAARRALSILSVSFVIVAIVTLLSFNRHLLVYIIFSVAIAWHFRIKKFGLRDLISILCVLLVLQLARNLRDYDLIVSELSFSQGVSYFSDQFSVETLSLALRGVLAGIAGWDVFTNVLDIVPMREEYFYGATYLKSLIGVFTPRVLGLSSYDALTPSAWYLQMYSPGTINHGYDFSMIAEAYVNFGLFMPIFFFALGMVLAILSNTIRLTGSPGRLFFSIIVLVALTFGLRSDANVVLKAVFFQGLAWVFFIKFLNKLVR